MKKFFVAILKFLVALLLLFITAGLLWTLYRLPMPLDRANIVWPFLGGLGGGLLFFVLIARVLVLYVFGHELTHWLAAKLFMRETGDIEAGTRGGNVEIMHPNIWITLAPYFIPFYTVLWIILYGIFRYGYGAPPPPTMMRIFYAGVGITYAFHVVCTLHSLMREQSDLRQHGHFLSLSLIAFCNTVIVAVGLLTVTRQWAQGWDLLGRRLSGEWHGLARLGDWLYRHLGDLGDWLRGLF